MPLLEKLPSSFEKSGWPWTEEIDPSIYSGGRNWPKISIVTPSYNQGEFIEETIRSILLQNYPNLEYIIIDGGSTDNTVEVIKKYEPWITYWVSEPDNGQSQAINKGIVLATGDIYAYINSDDFYLKKAFFTVAETYQKYKWDFFIGRRPLIEIKPAEFIKNPRSRLLSLFPYIYPMIMYRGYNKYNIPQECSFWRASLSHKHQFNEKLRFCLDADFFIRISPGSQIFLMDFPIGYFRIHPDSKTTNLQRVAKEEHEWILDQYDHLNTVTTIQFYSIYIKYWLKSLYGLFFRGGHFRFFHPDN